MSRTRHEKTDLITKAQQILASFSGNISPVRVSFGYGLALMLVAVLMVLLPLIYLGIVGSVSWL